MSAPRALIRLDALRNNFAKLRETAPGSRLVAVVKADAYGHGMLSVARALPDADAFAVARLPDAFALAEALPGRQIVLFGGVYNAPDLAAALARGIQPVVHCRTQLEMLEAARTGQAVVWIEIDTGMRRLGFEPEECAEVVARARAAAPVGEVRLMTHLANADDRLDPQTTAQLERFRAVLGTSGYEVSVANSPGLLGWTTSVGCGRDPAHSWMRCGLALYGVSPFPGSTGRELGLAPVMRFETTLVAVKPIRAGDRVGYGGTWRAPEDTVLGIVAAGYGDGYSRFLPSGAPVVINGRRVPLAGRVSMDFAAVDLGPDAADAIGDPVTLWGDELPVEEVAQHAGTVPYTLLCDVHAERVPIP